MRKNFSLFVLLLPLIALLSLSSCGGGDDKDYPVDDTTSIPSILYTEKGYFDGLLYYKIKSNETMEAAVVGAEKTITSVYIPPYIMIGDKVYTITSIYENAFNGCTSLTSVIIPNSVVSIGDYAFYDCNKLTSVTILNEECKIGKDAFPKNESPSYVEPTYTQHDPPQWENPASGGSSSATPYPADMTAYVQLPDTLKSYLSNADQLAAFCGTECRGVASRPANDEVWMMRIYGYVGDEITFRYYCATNKYMYNSVESIVLSNDSQKGTYDEPVTVYMIVDE